MPNHKKRVAGSAKKQKPNVCSKCKVRHLPPRGKNCQRSGLDISATMSEDAVAAPPSLSGSGASKDLETGSMRSVNTVLLQLVNQMQANEQLLSELVKSRTDASEGGRPQAAASAMSESSGPQFQSGAHMFTSGSVPDLSQLRSDVTILTQVSKLVDALDVDVRGMSGARMRKRGRARLGGDFAPLREVPWPQDFVIGHGAKRKLYYDDLTILQWVQGYAAIMR
jgi:hypothetical protein